VLPTIKNRPADAAPGGESQEVSSVIERRMRRGFDVRRFSITSNIEMAAVEIWLLKRGPEYQTTKSHEPTRKITKKTPIFVLVRGISWIGSQNK